MSVLLLDRVFKYDLGLSRADLRVFNFLVSNDGVFFDTHTLCKRLKCNLTTVQRSVKKLTSLNLLVRDKFCLVGGGYLYEYKSVRKRNVKGIVMNNLNRRMIKIHALLKNWKV